ncbi:hypothetical protein DFH08DRAFT_929206 [Mycena albidolilacea]|uniref:Uncharacterized protein n=1 Tax=Mycena albidolilacea TaxID=1033008 RepID=A0AAD7AQP5_9AGAR|nr:hypothetical protein DFH08DRAFT_929206 [Mycena albidolilacea]
MSGTLGRACLVAWRTAGGRTTTGSTTISTPATTESPPDALSGRGSFVGKAKSVFEDGDGRRPGGPPSNAESKVTMLDLLSAWLLLATVVSEDRRGLFEPPSAAEYLLVLGRLWVRATRARVEVPSEDEESRRLDVGVIKMPTALRARRAVSSCEAGIGRGRTNGNNDADDDAQGGCVSAGHEKSDTGGNGGRRGGRLLDSGAVVQLGDQNLGGAGRDTGKLWSDERVAGAVDFGTVVAHGRGRRHDSGTPDAEADVAEATRAKRRIVLEARATNGGWRDRGGVGDEEDDPAGLGAVVVYGRRGDGGGGDGGLGVENRSACTAVADVDTLCGEASGGGRGRSHEDDEEDEA